MMSHANRSTRVWKSAGSDCASATSIVPFVLRRRPRLLKSRTAVEHPQHCWGQVATHTTHRPFAGDRPADESAGLLTSQRFAIRYPDRVSLGNALLRIEEGGIAVERAID